MKMRDEELCNLIDREARQSIGVEDAFSADRERAMEFYMGEAKGELSAPGVQGRSKVVSKDLMDTVEWAMPGLMEALTGDDIVAFEPDNEEDEKGAEDATRYVNHLLFERNPGFVTLHDAIKSCLIARMGVTMTYCEDVTEDKQERYRGVSLLELAALESDQEIEVVEVTESEYQPQPQEGMPPEMAQAFDVVAKRSNKIKKFVCEGVPPEEIRISKAARSMEDMPFIEHRPMKTRSWLIENGWPKAEVMKIPKGSSEGDGEKASRHEYDNSYDDGDSTDVSQELVEVSRAWLYVDYDGDGVAEYRRVVKAGQYVHENEVTDDHPFALFSPILMPYKLIGLGFYDIIEDLQRIKTALTRATLDNVYLTNNPMKEVVEGQVNLDDLLNPRIGGIVRVKQINQVREIVTPFVAGASLELIQMFDQVRDTRTGVTEANSAMNAESLARGAVGSEGVQSLMQAGAQRQKLIARVLAETGLKRMYLLMLKEVTQYQDRAAQMKVNGRWLQVDPREWRTKYRVSVKVGLGAHDKAQEIANLSLIGNAQEKLLMEGLIDPSGAIHTVTRLAQAMGYKDPAKFFPPAQPKPPQPDPAVALEQMKQQGAQQLAQINAQMQSGLAEVKARTAIEQENMKQQAQHAQSQRELAMQAERDEMKLQMTADLEEFKAQLKMDADIQKAHIARQTAIDTAQISAEASAFAAINKPVSNDRQD